MFKESTDFVSARYGPADPFIGTTLMQLARAQVQSGLTTEAIGSLARAVEIRERTVGRETPATA